MLRQHVPAALWVAAIALLATAAVVEAQPRAMPKKAPKTCGGVGQNCCPQCPGDVPLTGGSGYTSAVSRTEGLHPPKSDGRQANKACMKVRPLVRRGSALGSALPRFGPLQGGYLCVRAWSAPEGLSP